MENITIEEIINKLKKVFPNNKYAITSSRIHDKDVIEKLKLEFGEIVKISLSSNDYYNHQECNCKVEHCGMKEYKIYYLSKYNTYVKCEFGYDGCYNTIKYTWEDFISIVKPVAKTFIIYE